MDRLEQLDQLGAVVGHWLWINATDIVSEPTATLQSDWLVDVRPKIVHGGVCMAAYSCVIPLNEARTLRSRLPLPSVSPYDEIRVRRS